MATIASQIPGVYVNNIPPNPLISGVPTNIIGGVGTANYGPVNSPTIIGSMQDYITSFGPPDTSTYDMGTNVYAATLQNAQNFICVRVTDGADTSSTINVLDITSPTAAVGLTLTSLYTGTYANNITAQVSQGSGYTPGAPTFKIILSLAGGVPEIFDNIGGSGETLWINMAAAINYGQSSSRGPSQLCVASFPPGPIQLVTVLTGGQYTLTPGYVLGSPGTGAVLSIKLRGLSLSINLGGVGYAGGDIITLAGGTFTTALTILVDTVSAGAIATCHILNVGNYTIIPVNPALQASTTGSGSGAKFDIIWEIFQVAVTSGGSGYTDLTPITFGSGIVTATGLVDVSATGTPALSTYTLTGGTSGNSSVVAATLIGSDSGARTGMYALRNTNAAIFFLSALGDATTWGTQTSFAASENTYCMGTMAAGYQNNISGAITAKQAVGVNSPYFKLMFGDWCQIFDPFNNQTRFISPQGFVSGILATLPPNGSSLNKIMTGIIATQKSAERQSYSSANILALENAGIDIITQSIPQSQTAFGCRIGNNTSSNALLDGDDYTRMINFLVLSFQTGVLGQFVGQPQTSTLQTQARNTLQGFLGTLANTSPPQINAYQVILDSSNNPPDQVALGYMQADVAVQLTRVVLVFVINLQANAGVTITVNTSGA